MGSLKDTALDFVIDKLTNSIENTSTGEVFDTSVVLLKGKNKVYLGVPGNLVAFACKVSVEMGYQGFLAFDAKTSLIKHYQETLQATHFRGLRMFIETNAALVFIRKYFKL